MSEPDPSDRGSRASWFRRPRVLIVAAATVVVLAVGGVLGYGIVSAQAKSDGGAPARADASTADATDGATGTPTAAPQYTSTPTPTTARPTSPRPTASDSPSDAPTFSVPPRPDTVLALDCNGLIDPAVRTQVLGDTGHLLDTGGPASEEGVAAERQSGVLRCDWFSSAETRSLSLYVLPDGLAAFRAFSASLGAYGSDQLGPDSRVTCDPTSPTSVWSCRGGFVASGHWVEYNFGGSQPAGTPAPFPLLSTVAASVSSALASAGPSRPTPMPAGAPQSWSSCAAFDTGSLRGAMQAPALQVPHADDWGLTLMEAAFRRVDYNTCGWYAGSGLTNVTFSIVPGAGWAVRDVAAETVKYPTGVSTLVSVPGAQAAVRTCFPAYGDCTVRMSVDGSMLSAHTISLPGSGRTPEQDALTAARYLVANLPG